MTKKEIFELLDILDDDDEVYIAVGEKILPVCCMDSGLEEMHISGEKTQVIAVLAPCTCGEEAVEKDFEIDGNINLN